MANCRGQQNVQNQSGAGEIRKPASENTIVKRSPRPVPYRALFWVQDALLLSSLLPTQQTSSFSTLCFGLAILPLIFIDGFLQLFPFGSFLMASERSGPLLNRKHDTPHFVHRHHHHNN